MIQRPHLVPAEGALGIYFSKPRFFHNLDQMRTLRSTHLLRWSRASSYVIVRPSGQLSLYASAGDDSIVIVDASNQQIWDEFRGDLEWTSDVPFHVLAELDLM